MEKKEYVSPEMETIEITEKYGIMQMIAGSGPSGSEEDDPIW